MEGDEEEEVADLVVVVDPQQTPIIGHIRTMTTGVHIHQGLETDIHQLHDLLTMIDMGEFHPHQRERIVTDIRTLKRGVCPDGMMKECQPMTELGQTLTTETEALWADPHRITTDGE